MLQMLWENSLLASFGAVLVQGIPGFCGQDSAYGYFAPYLDISSSPVSAKHSQLPSLAVALLWPALVLAVEFPTFGSKHESLELELRSSARSLERTCCSPAVCTLMLNNTNPGRAFPGISSSDTPFSCKSCF